jgi:hypothetical protein
MSLKSSSRVIGRFDWLVISTCGGGERRPSAHRAARMRPHGAGGQCPCGLTAGARPLTSRCERMGARHAQVAAAGACRGVERGAHCRAGGSTFSEANGPALLRREATRSPPGQTDGRAAAAPALQRREAAALHAASAGDDCAPHGSHVEAGEARPCRGGPDC